MIVEIFICCACGCRQQTRRIHESEPLPDCRNCGEPLNAYGDEEVDLADLAEGSP